MAITQPSTAPRPDLAAFNETVRADPQTLVKELRGLLGSRLVAIIARVSETRAVHQWAEGARSIRDPATIDRLRVAYQVARTVAKAESPAVAQAWMQGLNPQLDDQSPAWVLREGDLHVDGPRVIAAARHFAANG